MHRKIKMGMIGGGRGSFIGKVHHIAAILDSQIELVCGAFSSNPDISKQSGYDYMLSQDRVYRNYKEMIEREKKLPENESMDFVSIVTPNNIHFEPAKLALENGFHVVCDKPMTFNLKEAIELEQIVNKTGLLFCLTHTYTGYPMIKEAKEILKSGKLGKIRKIIAEYIQGWLSRKEEKAGNKQAIWRMDPNQAGISCTMGDVGVHAFNMIEYLTKLEVKQVAADLTSFVTGRKLDDDGSVLLRFDNGIKGILTASQICAGEENNFSIKIYSEKGGLVWNQMDPNTLFLKWQDKPMETIRTGWVDRSNTASIHTRIPAGHPEGYIEAFANLYRNFAEHLKSVIFNEGFDNKYDYPTVYDGVRGMAFIQATVDSSKNNSKWIELSIKK